MESGATRPRISIEVLPQISHRLRLVAVTRDPTIRRYVLQAIERRLREDRRRDRRRDRERRSHAGRAPGQLLRMRTMTIGSSARCEGGSGTPSTMRSAGPWALWRHPTSAALRKARVIQWSTAAPSSKAAGTR